MIGNPLELYCEAHESARAKHTGLKGTARPLLPRVVVDLVGRQTRALDIQDSVFDKGLESVANILLFRDLLSRKPRGLVRMDCRDNDLLELLELREDALTL